MLSASEMESVKQATLARVAAQRERHRRRPPFIRVIVGAGGMLLSIAGLLLVWAPEFGLPLLLAGFGLLALEFDWALRARAWTEWRALLLRQRIKRQPPAVKIALPLVMLVVVGVVVWQVFF
ncbi:putative transmembrane protein PGPGW [Micromonospora pisi]|uniref:Putative transmembrane protein PGPGW n=1 Tax=Micromonospora pisi TaxID=589240 RepID=A0A495JQ51_9ACTN|nr:PGPGW domain-containing protein [Micromonospora pisi]RKR91120.1 putative transmembrane protein PGPGW [Micromonospora pisi]